MNERQRDGGGRLHRRDGIYHWRRTDPRTGRRISRSTGCTRRDLARRVAVGFDEAFERRLAGLPAHDTWRQPLSPLLERWLASLEGDVSPKTLAQRRAQLERACARLDLQVTGDLYDVARLEDELLALRSQGASVTHLRRCYQHPLKQLSAWLAAHRRYLDTDPLADWPPFGRLPPEHAAPKRRALAPEEAARALLALERLHTLHRRRRPLQPVFLTLLVSGARASALLACDTPHFDRAHGRIDLGPGRGRKRRGAAALDPATRADLEAYVGERTAGPLLLGPTGARIDKDRLLNWWREAVALALVDALWPHALAEASAPEPSAAGGAEVPRLELAHLVARALLSGEVRVSKGGRTPRPETRARRARLARRVGELARALRPAWSDRMRGVDVHALRKTHRTWAEARGVAPTLIDKQLGHGGARTDHTADVFRLVAGSRTGRSRYLDLDSELFDPAKSAAAVRACLDEALAALHGAGESLLLPEAP